MKRLIDTQLTFDGIVANPPFEDFTKRKKTPHKLWIDFTHVHVKLLADGGELSQISPSSFCSPSSKVLPYFLEYDVTTLNLDCGKYFDVGSTFADYVIKKSKNGITTAVREPDGTAGTAVLSNKIFYLPSDFCGLAMSIHSKVMSSTSSTLKVKFDYVTCHNIILKKDNPTLSKTKTAAHIHPTFHTNPQTWYSSVSQPFASQKKVMWSRSGYTKPFYDDGVLGGTDMVYYVLVDTEQQGKNLAHNLNSALFKYIFKTAKWSGFGNEKVFCSLPDIAHLPAMTDEQLFDHFSLTDEERQYILSGKSTKSKAQQDTKGGGKVRETDRVRQTAEVFTCDEHADRLVEQMDPSIFTRTDSKILESSAGNGQLVMAILRRMKSLGRTDWNHIIENQLYMCEFMQDNLEDLIKRISDFIGVDVKTLSHNIIWADFIKISSQSITSEVWANNRYNPYQTERLKKFIVPEIKQSNENSLFVFN